MQAATLPLIGVIADHKTLHNTTDRSDSARTFVGVFRTYLDCLTAAGALPVVVPLDLSPASLRGIFDRLDGLLLTGGGDIDPALYGAEPLNSTVREIRISRDQTEIQMSQWAAESDMPLLGICRGHQVVNVALGGDLYMDIPAQIPDALTHDTHGIQPLDYLAHRVTLAPESKLAAILGATAVETNSRHHQAVRKIGDRLAVTGQADDGIIEALEIPDARYFISVQWHPENLCANGSPMTALFTGLTAAAAAYHDQHTA
jgi:putative glutamine amidotransferase